ncbi:DUF4349 domain-containing protein [Actinomadura viridis]|uniref:DUF4349 domain-containing protein n=1 Tax=Actinomadura viridis TaxID=58110 RepID=UPI00367F3C9B
MRIVRSVRHATCVLIALLLAAALAACGGNGDDNASSSEARRPAPAAPAAPEGAAGDSSGDRATTRGGSGTGSDTGRNPSSVQEGRPAGKFVAYTAWLRVRASDVDRAATRAKQLTTSAGGYIENESSSTAPAGATLALKIPSERYTSVLDGLTTQLGTKLSLRQEAEDVTREVADVDSRVRSAQATLASFRKLLDRARTVGEVINVEDEIARRQADLEALQARQKALQLSTRYATVTVTLAGPEKGEPEEDPRGGFVGGLQNGWAAFTAFVSGAALVLGWLLPFLALAALIGGPVLVVVRRRRARRPQAPPATGPDRPAPGAGPGPGGPGPGSGPGVPPSQGPGETPAPAVSGPDAPRPPE